jgi:hypothetical protein
MTRLLKTAAPVATLAVAVAITLAAGASGAVERNAGQLAIAINFPVGDFAGNCPAGTPTTTECFTFTSHAAVPGLGNATENYIALDDQSDPNCRHTTWTSAVITVAGKGEIDAALTAATACDPKQLFIGSATFKITGGSGQYAGASGSGTEAAGDFVSDIWTGTLTVPGLQFDTTAPTISGAVSKTVQVRKGLKRVRVTYKVTAEDPTDGTLPVTCTPRSGRRFKIGRTKVFCTATDSSANTATAQFTITVRQKR